MESEIYPRDNSVFRTPEETARLNKTAKEHEALEYLNKIVRGEIAAVEAYSKVIEKFPRDAERFELASFRKDHQNNVDQLTRLLRYQGEAPSDTSGAWGSGVVALMTMASFIGDRSAVTMLIEGEEHGLNQYSDVLNYQLPAVKMFLRYSYEFPQARINIGKLRGIANVI